MHGMKEKEKKVKRVASLVEAGMDSEEAVAQVDTFENLSDEQFEVFAATMKKYKYGGKVKADEDAEAKHCMDDDKKKKDAEAGMHGDMKKKKKDDDAEAGMHDDMKKKKKDECEAGMHDDMMKKKKKDDEAKAEELEAEIVEASEEVLDTAEALSLIHI